MIVIFYRNSKEAMIAKGIPCIREGITWNTVK
jgi:hypothetical protein